jgi:hypothetical protein
MGPPLLLGGPSGLLLYQLDTVPVNQEAELVYMWASIAMVVAAIAVNVPAAVCIRQKERTGISRLIVIDCGANIMTVVLAAATQTPWSILGSAPACLTNSILLTILTTWNRLVPVAIAVFRYLMVCHAVFCHNHGGDGPVWQVVTSGLVVVSLASTAVPLITTDSSLTYLTCMGSEERFRLEM